MFSFFGGGLGGNPETDGLNHGNNPISTALRFRRSKSSKLPIRSPFPRWSLRHDSAGAAMHRGGLGAIYEIEALAPGGADVFLLGERGRYPPFGVNGGEPAALNRFFWETPTGQDLPPLASKVAGVNIQRGQRVRLETPGGGGWGDPSARDPTLVARDLRLGHSTPEAARKQYRVIADNKGELDLAATTTLRSERKP